MHGAPSRRRHQASILPPTIPKSLIRNVPEIRGLPQPPRIQFPCTPPAKFVYSATRASERKNADVVYWGDMQTLVIDTNGIVKKLEQRGFSRTQAEGITEALKELDISPLATKSDLELALAKQSAKIITTIVTWTTGALLAQGALVVGLIQYLK
jgi:hypothetical protein